MSNFFSVAFYQSSVGHKRGEVTLGQEAMITGSHAVEDGVEYTMANPNVPSIAIRSVYVYYRVHGVSFKEYADLVTNRSVNQNLIDLRPSQKAFVEKQAKLENV